MDRRPVRPLTERIAPIVKAFMRSNHITQVQLASELERDQSYVSERVTGKRAFTTDELDAIALLAEWEPRRFIQHLADSLNDSGSTGVTRGPWPVGGVGDARKVASCVDERDRGGDDGQG